MPGLIPILSLPLWLAIEGVHNAKFLPLRPANNSTHFYSVMFLIKGSSGSVHPDQGRQQ
jgi:hypothetical protein